MGKLLSRCMTSMLMIGCVLPMERALGQESIALAVPSFTSESGALWQFSGDAVVKNGRLRLTRDRYNLNGAGIYHTPQNLDDTRSFSAYFAFRMWHPSGSTERGADGLAFVVQNEVTSMSDEGKDMGYRGAGQSLNIEFDTFENGGFKDPNNNHVGINVNGDAKSLAAAKAPFIMNDGNIYHAWVDYDGSQHLLQIRLSATAQRPEEPILSYAINLEEQLNSAVFVGFTAATGGCRQQHEVQSFFFHNQSLAGGIDTSTTQYSME
jgi:hypothetical protein